MKHIFPLICIALSMVCCQQEIRPEDATLTVDRDVVEVSYSKTTETVQVQSNVETRTTIAYQGGESDWIVLLPTWLKAGGGVLEFRIEANNTSKTPRRALATIRGNGVEKVIEIVQAGNPDPSLGLFLDFWGWGDATKAKAMTFLGNNRYTWTGYITPYEFKFTTSNKQESDYWTGYFRDPNAADYWTLKKTDQQTMFQLVDQGWSGGVYTINVDLNTAKVEMIPHIWPIGAGFSWGWDRNAAEKMTYQGNGILTWTGQMYPGPFKFLNRQDDWEGYYRKEGASDYWTLTTDGTGDVQFNIAREGYQAGNFTMTMDLNTKKVTLTANDQQKPDDSHLYLYFWGYETISNAKEMTPDGENKFTWSGYITDGDFKFMTAKAKDEDYWTGYFRDPDAADYWTLKKTSTQTMFKLSDKGMRDGYYTINVNLSTLKVEMIPHIWPVGNAFTWGWTKESAEEMTWLGNGILQWSGPMVQGDFKFLTQTDEWVGYWRDTKAADYWTMTTDGTGDPFFNLADKGLEAGNYTLKVDVLTKKVMITPNL